MSNVIVFCAAVIAAFLPIYSNAEKSELSAFQIMKFVDERDTGRTQVTESILTLIDKKDRQRVRHLKLYGSDTPEVEKSIIYFLSPSDVKGTSYLTFDWQNSEKEDDAWLYLPALKRVKRVASSDESGSFMGSDFSYSDINGTDLEDHNYELIKSSELIQGQDCWVIKSIPKSPKIIEKTGYTETLSWVRKDNFMIIQGKMQVKKGNKVKYFSATDIRSIDGIWTAMSMQMITTRNNKKLHSSILQTSNVEYNVDIDKSLFDTHNMQRGLP